MLFTSQLDSPNAGVRPPFDLAQQPLHCLLHSAHHLVMKDMAIVQRGQPFSFQDLLELYYKFS